FFKSKPRQSRRSFQLSSLIEILQDGICISNLSGEIIYLNKAGYELLELKNTDNLSQINFFDDLIQIPARVERLKKQINQHGLVKNYELQLKKLNGDVLDVILTINIIGDFRQQTIGFLFLFKDITELKKIQEQLLQGQKLESIGMMASGIAHDFNNILAAIIPNAELIKIASQKGDQNFKRAEIIEKSAHRASDIAQRLLTFTRNNDDKNYKMINLNQVIHDSFELLEHSIAKKVRIAFDLDAELLPFRGDETQMQQVIMNLVINAVDAMSGAGSIQLRTENVQLSNYYEVGSLDPGAYIRFSIKDTGEGIPLEILPKIFDPFFTTKEIGKGTGLGLSVVYGIIKSLNGHIEVDSKPNEGTRFDLYIPVNEEIPQEAKRGPQPKVSPQNLQILIIDDEDYVLNILGDILDFLGYQIIKFNNGFDAVEYYERNSKAIDYIILDLKMPRMDGRMTSSELKKINPNANIIFTSGFDEHPTSDEHISGMVGFLKKPYSINQVAKSLEEILNKAN
ncbi:MAG: ATP-binding protein, partial [Calditrichia bacterium]